MPESELLPSINDIGVTANGTRIGALGFANASIDPSGMGTLRVAVGAIDGRWGSKFEIKTHNSELCTRCPPDTRPTPTPSPTPTPLPTVTGFLPWSDPASWPNGQKPTAGSNVVIGPGVGIAIDESTPPLGVVTVQDYGWLTFAENVASKIVLTATRIVVDNLARFSVGNSTSPFPGAAEISGSLPKAALEIKGDFEIYGKPPTRSWTRLNEDAAAAATKIVVEEDIAAAGDIVVIAASDWAADEYDQAAVASVATVDGGKELTLTTPLKHRHIGSKTTVAGRSIDMHAEVAVISRNVVFRCTDLDSTGIAIVPNDDSTKPRTVVLDSIAMVGFGYSNRSRLATLRYDSGVYGVHFDSVFELRVANKSHNLALRRSVFSDGAAPAIFVRGSGIVVEDNVVFNTSATNIGFSSSAYDCKILRNLVIGATFAPTSLQDNRIMPAGFYLTGTNPGEFRWNVVAGAQRVGFRLGGSDCERARYTMSNNTGTVLDPPATLGWVTVNGLLLAEFGTTGSCGSVLIHC
eukprot:tig00000157_g9652.t1